VEIGERGIDFLFVVDVCRLFDKAPEEFMTEFRKASSGRKGKTPARLVRRDRKRPV
jgi:hypothetical protein